MIRGKIIDRNGEAILILPPEVLEHLKVAEGDDVFLYKARDGGFRITRDEPEMEKQLEVVDEIMREDHDILVALK
jgi:putative addiction module antidote